MAKKTQDEQIDLFPVQPAIAALGLTQFKLAGAEITATLAGVTNVGDIALLDNTCWQKAVACWLLNLCDNNESLATGVLRAAFHEQLERQGGVIMQEAKKESFELSVVN